MNAKIETNHKGSTCSNKILALIVCSFNEISGDRVNRDNICEIQLRYILFYS